MTIYITEIKFVCPPDICNDNYLCLLILSVSRIFQDILIMTITCSCLFSFALGVLEAK